MSDAKHLEELKRLLKGEVKITRPDTSWPEVHIRFLSNSNEAREFINLLHQLRR